MKQTVFRVFKTHKNTHRHTHEHKRAIEKWVKTQVTFVQWKLEVATEYPNSSPSTINTLLSPWVAMSRI